MGCVCLIFELLYIGVSFLIYAFILKRKTELVALLLLMFVTVSFVAFPNAVVG